MRGLRALLRVLLWLLAAALGALALGAFASLNPAAPIWMRTLSAAEGLLLGQVSAPYPRGLAETLLCAATVFWAALPSRLPAPR